MKNPMVDNITFLKDARAAISDLEAAKKEQQKLVVECKRCEKLIATEEKAVSDQISAMVKERRNAVQLSYDKELGVALEKLRKQQAAKARAKSISMNERIKEETAALAEENNSLAMTLATLYKQEQAPRMTRNRIFHILFMPRGAVEWLIVMLILAVMCYLVPVGIIKLCPNDNIWLLAGAFCGYILLAGGLYLYLNNSMKWRYIECHRQARAINQQIQSNKNKMKVITTAIKKDSDESGYNLEGYNYDIAKLEAEVDEIGGRKQEALNTFDQVTRKVISDEISEGARERIEKLRVDSAENKEKLQEAENNIQKINIHITDAYEGYLGKDFLNKDRLDSLIIILEQEKASSLTEAIAYYETSKD